MDLSFLSQADAVMLEMEKAKRALDAAKADFENAKRSYDELLARADEVGVPKAKLKKLVEDRIALLFESGLLDFLEKRNDPQAAKKPRKPKRTQTPETEEPTAEATEKSDSDEGL
jgi:hypothetical protein